MRKILWSCIDVYKRQVENNVLLQNDLIALGSGSDSTGKSGIVLVTNGSYSITSSVLGGLDLHSLIPNVLDLSLIHICW